MSLVHSVLGTGDTQVPFLLTGQCASGFLVWEEAVPFQAGVGHRRLSTCSHRWLNCVPHTPALARGPAGCLCRLSLRQYLTSVSPEGRADVTAHWSARMLPAPPERGVPSCPVFRNVCCHSATSSHRLSTLKGHYSPSFPILPARSSRPLALSLPSIF